MSFRDTNFEIDFIYLFLFIAVMSVIYFSIDKSSHQSLQAQSKTVVEESESGIVAEQTNEPKIITLSGTTKGECFNNRFSSDKGTVQINGSDFNTNWRELKFKHCIEKDNKHYLVAEAYGNKAVGYLVFDDIDDSNRTEKYGCVLHNEFKIIKRKPADFLNVDCSPSGLEKLR